MPQPPPVRAGLWPLVTALTLAAATPLHAGLLEGRQLQVQDVAGGSPVPGFTADFTVRSAPGAVEVADWGGAGRLSLDFFDTGSKTSALVLHGLSTATFAPRPNLLRISEPVATLPAIAQIGITPLSADLRDHDFLSRIDAGPGFATFDLGGLAFTAQSALRFDVTFNASSTPGPVPEPHPGPGQGQGSGSGQGQGQDPGPRPSDAPEPGTLALLAAGATCSLGGWWRRRRAA
jgi:hypothetical protein